MDEEVAGMDGGAEDVVDGRDGAEYFKNYTECIWKVFQKIIFFINL